MKPLVTVLLLGAWLVGPALAQPEPAEKPRAGMGRRAQPLSREQARANTYQARIERIRKKLNLTENQQEEYDRIANEFLQHGPSEVDRDRQQELLAEMRTARKESNWERVNELREELRQIQTRRPMSEFYDQIEKILNEDQLKTLAEIRARAASERDRGRSPLAQLEVLREQLGLSDEQAERWDALYTELEGALGKDKADPEETNELIQEIVKAAEEGDTERVKQLRAQLPDPRGESDRLISEFLTDVERFLEPEQKAMLERFQREMSRGRSRTNLRDCFRFASRLDLSEEQSRALRQIQQESRQAERQARRDPGAQERLFEEVQQEIRDLLTDEQVAEFDRWLAEQQSRGSGREPREKRPRGERRGKRAADEEKP